MHEAWSNLWRKTNMASNFKIRKNSLGKSGAALKISGDFDGASAWALIHELKKTAEKNRQILIETDGLKTLFPYGKNVFETNAKGVLSNGVTVKFTGGQAPFFLAVALVRNRGGVRRSEGTRN